MSERRRHPMRRWYVYCFVAWALLSTTVGSAILGTTLAVLGAVWFREFVLLAGVALIAFHAARGMWRAALRTTRNVSRARVRARRRRDRRRSRRDFAGTLTDIRRLPQISARRG